MMRIGKRASVPDAAILAALVDAIPAMNDFRAQFLEFALARDVLRFGDFVTKAGRKTPYFFNAGLFCDGASVGRLGGYYAQALLASDVRCDQLYGPAYKGITLAAATAIALAASGHNLPFSFNRKEAKDHGEGGNIIGAPLAGRVMIVDDVITAGTSVRESVATIRAHGATPAGVLIALDRMERGQGEKSAVQEVQESYGMPVVAIATLDDLMTFIETRSDLADLTPRIAAYRAQYGTHP
jgi:orotate phosphoribosyltransferase